MSMEYLKWMGQLSSNTTTPHLHIAFLVWWCCGGWRQRRWRWLLTTNNNCTGPASLSINPPTNLMNPADFCASSSPCTPTTQSLDTTSHICDARQVWLWDSHLLTVHSVVRGCDSNLLSKSCFWKWNYPPKHRTLGEITRGTNHAHFTVPSF